MQGVSANNLKTFTLFPKLSCELHLKIGGLCAPEPALVTPMPEKGRLNAEWSMPAVLQVCGESRYEFLAREEITRDHGMYRLCRFVNLSGVKTSYMRMEEDRLYLNAGNISLMPYSQFIAIQHIVIHCKDFPGSYGNELRFRLRYLPSLKSIAVLFSSQAWRTLSSIPNSGGKVNRQKLQSFKNGIDHMLLELMERYKIWGDTGAPTVELVGGEWPGEGRMVFPEREEDDSPWSKGIMALNMKDMLEPKLSSRSARNWL
ncbi:hypothetical protein BKA64DRAFT_410312 [Cadophora sp. MPI-SDFR-AT-0126]|nr:hypothetical protein BKA64DRAFT_410312 [Leotiomycetes sp. MPI-SDFR-AT-0126]